jgi:hypothetical protein
MVKLISFCDRLVFPLTIYTLVALLVSFLYPEAKQVAGVASVFIMIMAIVGLIGLRWRKNES